jgi:hypothetical protein
MATGFSIQQVTGSTAVGPLSVAIIGLLLDIWAFWKNA